MVLFFLPREIYKAYYENYDLIFRGVIFMKKMIIFVLLMMVVFTGCGKKEQIKFDDMSYKQQKQYVIDEGYVDLNVDEFELDWVDTTENEETYYVLIDMNDDGYYENVYNKIHIEF